MMNIALEDTPANRLGALALWMAANPQALISHNVDEIGGLSITASIKGQYFTVVFAAAEQGLAECGDPTIILTSAELQENSPRHL
ncbi:MAG: hypothetical protein WAW39_15905 [Prosthecobacter sp.]|uniref:hypothetical protein n=1 Tax=Prosthecobacter sp. TaxID=1965333 RepID=UPI003BB220FB